MEGKVLELSRHIFEFGCMEIWKKRERKKVENQNLKSQIADSAFPPKQYSFLLQPPRKSNPIFRFDLCLNITRSSNPCLLGLLLDYVYYTLVKRYSYTYFFSPSPRTQSSEESEQSEVKHRENLYHLYEMKSSQ